MQIIDMPIKALMPYKRNPRKNDKAVEYVANSIRQFGFKVPIVIDSNYEIVCGHTRWKAAKTLGMETVPCIMADDLNEDQIRAFRLADNKTAEMADWDFDLLEMEFNDIDPDLFDMSDFGFFQDDNATDFEQAEEQKGSLKEKYLVPPFSVIYCNKPDWLARKRAWVSKGLHSEIGRRGDLLTIQGATQRQTSYKRERERERTLQSVQEQRKIKQLSKAKAYADGLIEKREQIRKGIYQRGNVVQQ